MTGSPSRNTRRAFFLSGGAAIGAGVATAVGASALKPESPTSPDQSLSQLREQLASIEDREAIRKLHLAFTALIESQTYESAAELFDEHACLDLSGVSAKGKREILHLLTHDYRHQNAATFHGAYRQNMAQQQGDAVTLSEDRRQAAATFHVDVELCTPLQADCTVAQMARLQGHVANRRWETGRFEAKYVKTRGEWKMASLIYRSHSTPM